MDSESRFFTKKRIIVGNVCQFIPEDKRSSTDSPFSYKWMVYVRGPPGEEDISSFVKAIKFVLHESYRPYDIVVLDTPPFHLVQFGWGESSILITLEFVDSGRNAPHELVYRLKLDPYCTGKQVLGDEKVFELELDRNSSFRESLGAADGVDVSRDLSFDLRSISTAELSSVPKAKSELANLLIKWSSGRPTSSLLLEMAMDVPLSCELLALSSERSPAFEKVVADSYKPLLQSPMGQLPKTAVDYALNMDAKNRSLLQDYRSSVLYNRIQQERIYVQQTLIKLRATDDLKLLPQSLQDLYSLPARTIFAFLSAQALVITRHLYYDAANQLRQKDSM